MIFMEKTASGNRIHIGVFGRTNAGKSSFVNALTGQSVSIVSDIAGTTTDVVKKAMEIHDLGPCIVMDTAGLDDHTLLKKEREQATYEALQHCDAAFLLFFEKDESAETEFLKRIKDRKIPVIGVMSHTDTMSSEEREERIASIEKKLNIPVIGFSAVTGSGIEEVRKTLIQTLKGNTKKRSLVDGMVEEGDTVILVMPQDREAPVGRLIQPQVMAIRDLLDHHCYVISVATEEFSGALSRLKEKPDLVIVDSQVFGKIAPLVPEGVKLTSFSILMAALKGDISYYAESADKINELTDKSRVLIAECCTHAPVEEDIGRVKIPALLRKKAGQGLQIDVTAGTDFPENIQDYDLVIQCGGCMFNRRYIMNRIEEARKQGIPMTNYGIAIAKLNGILDQVTIPEGEKENG